MYSEPESYTGELEVLGQTIIAVFKTIYASNEKLLSKVYLLQEGLEKANAELNFLKQAREDREKRKLAQQKKTKRASRTYQSRTLQVDHHFHRQRFDF